MGSLRQHSGKIGLTGLMLLGLVAPTVQAKPRPVEDSSKYLVDLSRPHWCYDCVVDLVDRYQVMDGFSDHTFRGDWTVSRYDMAVTLRKTLDRLRVKYQVDIPSEDGNIYTLGVSQDHWAYSDVHILVKDYNLMTMLMDRMGIRGENQLTRAELAYVLSELLMRAEAGTQQEVMSDARVSTRAIDLDPDSVYNPYVYAALDRFSLLTLHEDHTFRPQDSVTRYELAAALCRLFELVEGRFA